VSTRILEVLTRGNHEKDNPELQETAIFLDPGVKPRVEGVGVNQ